MKNKQLSNNRYVGLDLLRIALALLIYMFHSWMHFGCQYSFLTNFVSVGAIAMTGFFLLSGYCMCLVYRKQNLMDKNNLKLFYLKRLVSVVPLYYALALIFMIFFGSESLQENLLLFPIEALCLQSTFSSLFNITHNGGTWFISCIMLAYLIYPFLQLVINLLSNKTKVIILLVLMFVDVWAAIISVKFNTEWTYDSPFYRILEFTIGLIIADFNLSHCDKKLNMLRSWGALTISVAILVVGVSIVQYFTNTYDYMLLNVIVLPCFSLMLLPLGCQRMPYFECSRVISYLSKISYAFFLSQFLRGG